MYYFGKLIKYCSFALKIKILYEIKRIRLSSYW